jgi:hypothetical protein
MNDDSLPAGLFDAARLSFAEQDELCRRYLKSSYPHEEIFGGFCPLAEHVAAPFEAALQYCAAVPSLAEWTLNIRRIEHRGGGLYRGKMIFSTLDAAAPATDIFLRVEVSRGEGQALVCYPCAWDQPDDLWMRYFFVLADAELTLGRPGTVVMWNNCKHRFYDRVGDESAAPVPDYIAAGRARTDRPWPGDGWPLFYALHRLELANLKAILEHRHPLTR